MSKGGIGVGLPTPIPGGSRRLVSLVVPSHTLSLTDPSR